jgi:hypothetical protein
MGYKRCSSFVTFCLLRYRPAEYQCIVYIVVFDKAIAKMNHAKAYNASHTTSLDRNKRKYPPWLTLGLDQNTGTESATSNCPFKQKYITPGSSTRRVCLFKITVPIDIEKLVNDIIVIGVGASIARNMLWVHEIATR